MKELGENGLTIEQELEKYKRYLRDRDLEIKDLQEELDETKACYMGCNKERKKYKSKLDKIEEVLNEQYLISNGFSDNNNIITIDKIKSILKESE